jgi:hypothetical protein
MVEWPGGETAGLSKIMGRQELWSLSSCGRSIVERKGVMSRPYSEQGRTKVR